MYSSISSAGTRSSAESDIRLIRVCDSGLVALIAVFMISPVRTTPVFSRVYSVKRSPSSQFHVCALAKEKWRGRSRPEGHLLWRLPCACSARSVRIAQLAQSGRRARSDPSTSPTHWTFLTLTGMQKSHSHVVLWLSVKPYSSVSAMGMAKKSIPQLVLR